MAKITVRLVVRCVNGMAWEVESHTVNSETEALAVRTELVKWCGKREHKLPRHEGLSYYIPLFDVEPDVTDSVDTQYAVGDRVTVHDMLAVSEGAKGTIDSTEYPLIRISVCVRLDEPSAFGRRYVIVEYKNLRPLSECVNDGCTNERTPSDYTKQCITCNPYGDSLVMNNDPEYQSWLFRSTD